MNPHSTNHRQKGRKPTKKPASWRAPLKALVGVLPDILGRAAASCLVELGKRLLGHP